MKLILLVLLTSAVISCSQHSQSPSPPNAENPTTATIDTIAKQFLIDVSNSAWFQSEVANVALKKSHDTVILSLAQTISKQYLRIKDRAKIVSIPYKINAPYFLTGEQNTRIKELNGMDNTSFDKEFILQAQKNNDLIEKQCSDVQASSSSDSTVTQLVNFCKSIVETTNMRLQKKK